METDSVDVTVSVPVAVADPDTAVRARLLLVLDAVRTERLTIRAAARALGIASDRMLDLAREHGVPAVRYDEADLDEDFATVEKLERLRSAG